MKILSMCLIITVTKNGKRQLIFLGYSKMLILFCTHWPGYIKYTHLWSVDGYIVTVYVHEVVVEGYILPYTCI